MKHHRLIRVQKLQDKNHMVGKTFSCIGHDERRAYPWLGSSWFREGRDDERAEFIKRWEAETQRLLQINPNLKII